MTASPPRLVAFTDLSTWPDSVLELTQLCAEAQPGTVAVVVRDRDLEARARLELGRRLGEVARRFGQRLVVADRLDLVRVLNAQGLHLPKGGLSPSLCAREGLSWVSRSGHDALSLPDEELASLSAVFVSPVFARRKGREAIGIEGLSQTILDLRKRKPALWVFALGGVNATNCHSCLVAGADGVAAIGAVMAPEERSRLLRALDIERKPQSARDGVRA